MKAICLTGPESTGKTCLGRHLSDTYRGVFISEYAREYLHKREGKYQYEDLITMAKAQYESQEKALKYVDQFVFFDTDLITYKIWSEYKYGKCDPWILEHIEKQKIELYLLCDIDVPWEADPLRENPKQREELFSIYQRELERLDVPYIVVSGSIGERGEQFSQYISRLK